MDPLSLVFFGVAAFFGYKALTAGKSGSSGTSDSARGPAGSQIIAGTLGTRETTIVDPNAQGRAIAQTGQAIVTTIGQALKDVPVVGSVAPAVAAYMVAGSMAGMKLTGDAWGALAGGLMPTHGNVGNLGRLIGIDIDKMFGGSGTGGTGIVAQIGGFLTALSFFSAIASPFGAMPFLGPVALMAYGVATLISDLNALSFGQKGRLENFNQLADNYFKETIKAATATLAQNPQITAADIADARNQKILNANALALTLGYVKQQNKTLKTIWMKKPWGLFQGEAGHSKWGEDRGVYLSSASLSSFEVNLLTQYLGTSNYPPAYGAVIDGPQKERAEKWGTFLANAENWGRFLIAVPYGALVFDDATHLSFGLKEGAFEASYIMKPPQLLERVFNAAALEMKNPFNGKAGYDPTGDTKFGGVWLSASATKADQAPRWYLPKPIPAELQQAVTLAKTGMILGQTILSNAGFHLTDWV